MIDDNIIGDTIGHYYVNTIQKNTLAALNDWNDKQLQLHVLQRELGLSNRQKYIPLMNCHFCRFLTWRDGEKN